MNKIKIEKMSSAVGIMEVSEVMSNWVHPTTGEEFTTVKVHAKQAKEYINISLMGKFDSKAFEEFSPIDFKDVTVTIEKDAKNGFNGGEAKAKANFKFMAVGVIYEKPKQKNA